MKIKYRVIILLILAIIFFIASPVLILWAVGYRWNPKKNFIEKTGLLYVKTEPSGAVVYLNDKERKERTPARIKFLLPDNYNLKISKENYIPYEKTVAVRSGLATFEDTVILFKQNLPILAEADIAKTMGQLLGNQLRKISDSYKKNGLVYYVKNNRLMSREPKKTIENEILTLPYKNYLLSDIIEPYFIFKNGMNDKILVLDKDAQIIFDGYGKEIVFSKNKNEFMVYDDFEINIYNIEKKEKIFITRSSKKIINGFFLENKNYIIYALVDGVYAMEKLTSGLGRIVLTLANFTDIESAMPDEKQENIYILGVINKKSGVYVLNFR